MHRAIVGLLVALAVFPAAAGPDAPMLYQRHCADCHGVDRLGGQGPALLPENLGRLRPAQAEQVIAKGRPATQMPAFGDALTAEEIKALAAHAFTPLPKVPRWGADEIAASRVVNAEAAALSAQPVRPAFAADPLNLFVVVESGDHHVSIVDGDRFEVLHRFRSRFALHGGPKFTPDGRFVFFASRDGWVTKFDLYTLKIVAEARAGINARNLALSADGRWVAVANYLPNTLAILDAGDLRPQRVFDVADLRGRKASRVSAVYQARPRNSFVAALKDIPEIWEVSTDPNAPPVFSGMVHSHEKGMVEGLATSRGLFALRRIALEEPLDDFMFDQSYRHLLGSTREGNKAVVVNLTVGRPIRTIPIDGLPHLGSGITWARDGRTLLATPSLNRAHINVIDMTDWSVVKQIPTDGPGFFLRSHENTRYAWTDTFLGRARDNIHIIDKGSLDVVRTLKPAPGRTVGHVEFTRDGRFAVVSVWEMDGAIVIYDAASFAEVKRLPMVKPSGKYNVHNKITFSEGTSH